MRVTDPSGEFDDGLMSIEVLPVNDAAKSTVVQTRDLKVGWHLISFYVEAEDMSTGTVFGEVIAAGKLVKITSLSGVYDPTVPPFMAPSDDLRSAASTNVLPVCTLHEIPSPKAPLALRVICALPGSFL